MPTSPTISIFAAVTHALPGPTTRSTGASCLVREAVRERADRLDAARDEERVHVEQSGRAEEDRVDVPVPVRRAGHDDRTRPLRPVPGRRP